MFVVPRYSQSDPRQHLIRNLADKSPHTPHSLDQEVRDVVQRGHDFGPRSLGFPRPPPHPLALPEPNADATEAAWARPVPRVEEVIKRPHVARRAKQCHVGGAAGRGAAAPVELELVGQVAAVGLELKN